MQRTQDTFIIFCEQFSADSVGGRTVSLKSIQQTHGNYMRTGTQTDMRLTAITHFSMTVAAYRRLLYVRLLHQRLHFNPCRKVLRIHA